MKIFQFLKNIFSKNKIKAIAAPKEEIKEEVQPSRENESFKQQLKIENSVNPPKKNQSREDKVKELLKNIGCTDDTINSIDRINDIDINNLKSNIMTLTQLGITKLQLANIIGFNWATLYMKNEDLKNSIKCIRDFLKDTNSAKNMIVRNSNIISKDTGARLNNTKEILDKYNIPYDNQIQILEENPIVIFLSEQQLKNSLDLIRSCVENDEQLIREITIQPIIVGFNQIGLIRSYINS